MVPNTFGTTLPPPDARREGMDATDATAALERTAAPTDRPTETLAVADAPPPEPLRRTLETLADLPEDGVLVQHNDRRPQHLYPRLEDRGYEYDTVDTEDGVVTAVWRP